MGKKIISVVLVDDEYRALNRMDMLLKNFPETQILGQFEQAEAALEYILKTEPDLVFLDVEMPGISGLEIASSICKANLQTEIIFVTAHDHYAIDALRKQAFDYLLKPINIDELKAALQRYSLQHSTSLSKRELEIIRLLGKGLNSRQIGEELFLSRHTVDTYRRKILEKFDVQNTAELIQIASQGNLF